MTWGLILDGGLEKALQTRFGHENDAEDTDGEMSPVRKMNKRRLTKQKRELCRPYKQMSRGEKEERQMLRNMKMKERMKSKCLITAPYNTTQFLMLDKDDQSFSDTSVESEEDFIIKEFRKDYDNEHLNRLESMTKDMLLSELLLAEQKYKVLEHRMETVRQREDHKVNGGETGCAISIDESNAVKIMKCQNELENLRRENQMLTRENMEMITRRKQEDDMSSSSSENSSDSSSDSSSDDSEDDLENEVPNTKLEDCISSTTTLEDTGYDSSNFQENIL